jgi:transcriptional regulator with XRE-family HTH domain
MDPSTSLRLARRELGLSLPQLAAEMGVSHRTLEKWASPAGSGDRREMPLIARKLLSRLLDDEKRKRLAAGDRRGAETIDAIAAQLDPARLRAALRAFDLFQRAASRLAPLGPLSSRKPRSFANLDDKNAWQRREETRNARRIRAASARTR